MPEPFALQMLVTQGVCARKLFDHVKAGHPAGVLTYEDVQHTPLLEDPLDPNSEAVRVATQPNLPDMKYCTHCGAFYTV